MKKLKRNVESLVLSVCMAGIFLFPCAAFAQKEASASGRKEVVRKKNERKFFQERRKNMHGRRGGPAGFFLGKLTSEEHAELRRLSASGDKEKFRSKLRELRKKYASEEDKKVFLLEEKYHAAKTQAEKDAVRKELKEAVLAQVKRRNDLTLKHIASVEKKLRKLKEFHAKNVQNTDNIAEKMTEFLCTKPSERKKFYPAPGKRRPGRPAPAEGVKQAE